MQKFLSPALDRPALAWSVASLADRRPTSGGRGAATGGFTLLELLVVIAIVGVLSMLAAPEFVRLTAAWRVASNLETVVTTFDYARSEAVSRNTLVQVCRTTDPTAATPACSDAAAGAIPGNDWATGWIVYARPQDQRTPAPFNSASDELLRRVQPEGVRPSGTRSIIATGAGDATVSFGPGGLRAGGLGNPRSFVLDYRDPANTGTSPAARCLTVLGTGKARIGTWSAGVCNVG